jgi:hypothetical protein
VTLRRVVQVTTVASLAWGALAFGATYQWASRPLMAACVLAGALAWLAARRVSAAASIAVPVTVLAAMAVLAVAVALQLLPLPAILLTRLSPTALTVVTQHDLAYVAQPGSHPVSIAPDATRQGLALLIAFGAFLAGLTRFMSVVGTRWITWSLTGLGVLLALIGIIQKASHNGRIYGFWTTQMGGDPFGPFVNKNHFAAWMLMALPLTMALLCAGIARGMVHVRPTFRDRALWFGSRDSSQLLLLAAAAVLMALSLVMTMSRSGMTSFLLAIAVTGVFVLFGGRARTGKSVAGLLLASLVILVVAWVGVDAIVTRFTHIDRAELQQRPEAWADAWGIAQRFALTGAGLNTYGVATVFFQQHQLAFHYAQAHNDYLQVLAEGGALVTIPVALLLVVFAREVRRRFLEDGQVSVSSWWARAGAVTGLLAIALQETVDFGLQMPGNAALFVVLCAIAMHRAPVRHLRDQRGRP